MKKKAISKLYLERLLKHHDRTIDGKFYAISRMDLLVISISGGGIYLIFEIIKFFNTPNPVGPIRVPDLTMVKISGCLFTLSIVVNFFSQWTGYKANKFELESTEISIEEEKKRKIDEKRRKIVDCRVGTYNSLTSWLNGISTVLMLGGIVILTIFNLFIF